MSDGSFTEVSSESWFSRLGNAIKGVLIGIVLFIVSFPLLWWNEGRAVKTAKGLQEFSGSVTTVKADAVDPKNDKTAVHVTGEAVTKDKDPLGDATFGVSAPVIRFRRVVEMYQWKQSEDSKTTKKLGGGSETTTTYKYDKGWENHVINSTGFKEQKDHENPAKMRYENTSSSAKDVRLGAFRLPEGLVDQWTTYEKLPFDDKQLASLAEPLSKQGVMKEGVLYLPNAADGKKPDLEKPQVGDLRISFEVVKPGVVSVAARQVGDSFESWQSKTGSTIFRLMPGTVSAEGMVEKMQAENTMLTWILRGAGFLAMALGLGMVFSPLTVLADVIPLFGDLLQMGTSLFAGVVAAALSLLTISIAWIVYRPVLGILLLAVSIGLIVALKMLGKGKKKPAAA